MTPESIINRIIAERPTHDGALTVAGIGHHRRMPLSELHDRARAVATALRRRGVQEGDRIGVLAGNRLEWVLLDLAALMIKAQTAGFEPGKFTPDIELVERYDLDLLYTDASVGDGAPPTIRPIAEVAEYAEHDPRELKALQWEPDECTTVKFTSGSTGIPKGLEATVASVDSSLCDVQGFFGHLSGDDILVFLPLSLLQQRYWLYSAMHWGHDVTITTYQSVFAVMPMVEPTVVMGVPAFFDTAKRYIEGPLADDHDAAKAAVELFGPRIRYMWTGSAPADQAVLRFFKEAGLPIFEGYGLNETCIATKNHPGAHREGSVGKALPGKEILIGDDNVVRVRSDHPVNTTYAYAPPGESERIFKPGGIVRTGDFGHLDDDGFLFIHGRADDVIVLDNGRKVIVRVIESRFRDTGAVAECVLYCPDQIGLVAVVSPYPGPVDTEAITAALEAVNAASEPDERVTRVIIAEEPFTIDNDLLTSQFKPIRKRIQERYRARIDDPKEGLHAR